MARKTPQQKKRESYLKDSRSNYGEHSKSSRRNIRRHKRHVNRSNRRSATQSLSQARGGYDPELVQSAESSLTRRRAKSWEKVPDAPLGEILEKKLKHRVRMGIERAQDVKRKIQRIRKRMK